MQFEDSYCPRLARKIRILIGCKKRKSDTRKRELQYRKTE